ncbi:hypothetical protein HYH03_010929 [Edaphochlamys debaryana]|uniref:GPI mannosyltransferase 1 n=1 Tax=Edaphochlamys debaryana TaxID=47281 RepID=A0A835Y0X8_9CHLO|nr:hypothetical protein HYH03_010929 [Edaphochlamys debaryana]|eukprot:KAG2490535.1 hypothetical protein HYH03_010929 [Edaphochlamys debaryana]
MADSKPGLGQALASVREWHVVALAALVRVALVCWAEYQDAHMAVKYTDIDYVVFTDAARFVASGQSPYKRSTYRYSPLLAYLVLPNIWLHPAWGKALFSASDLAAAWLMSYLLTRTGTHRSHRTLAIAAWLFNPYTLPISTRGSCDVLSVLLLLSLLACLLRGRIIASGALYGLAVHFRIYPVIYGPAIVLFLLRRSLDLTSEGHAVQGSRQGPAERGLPRRGAGGEDGEGDFQSPLQTPTGSPVKLEAKDEAGGAGGAGVALGPRQATAGRGRSLAGPLVELLRLPPSQAAAAALPAAAFAATSAAVFLLLGLLFYGLYGREFLNEAFVHHLTRKDPRHNFSPYYYPIYLGYGSTADAGAHGAGVGPSTGPGSGAVGLLQRSWARLGPVLGAESWRLALLPQAAAVGALAAAFHEDLPSAWLLQTWAFVALNKVVTAQYFVWYLSLLPLALPALAAQRAVPARALAAAGGGWVAAQLHWLAWAYQLEMRGRSVHVALWAAGLAFLGANAAALALLCRALRPALRRRGAGAGPGGDGGGAREGEEESKARGGAGAGAGGGGGVATFLEASLALARAPPEGAITRAAGAAVAAAAKKEQ